MRGVVTILICAATILLGEAYNPSRLSRDDSDKPEKPVYDDPSLASVICAAEGSNGVLVAHQDCSKFYVCNNGRRVVMQCPPTLLYNAVKRQCDWANNVICPVRVPESDLDIKGRVKPFADTDDEVYSAELNVVNDDYNLAPQICAGKGSNGVLVAHKYCNHFYKCNNGFPAALPCPPELLYNPQKEQCDWPKNVVCGTRIIPDPNIDDSAENDVPAADDDSAEDDAVVNDDYNLAPAICAAEGSDGILVAHRFCNRFNKCANRVAVALRCQPDLLYNPKNKQCDWPQNVVCGTRIIPDPEIGDDEDSASAEKDEPSADDDSSEEMVVHDDYTLAPVICAAEGSDGVLVAHRFCNRFNKCDNRVPVALRCQKDLLYNPSKLQCDWPENVMCGTRVIPFPDMDDGEDRPDNDEPAADDDSAEDGVVNDDYNLAPAICAAEGSDGVLVAHRYCNLYNKCDHGKPVALRCQLNLVFNPKTKQCDWPQNVDCNGRII